MLLRPVAVRLRRQAVDGRARREARGGGRSLAGVDGRHDYGRGISGPRVIDHPRRLDRTRTGTAGSVAVRPGGRVEVPAGPKFRIHEGMASVEPADVGRPRV